MKLRFLLIVILMSMLMMINCGVNEESAPLELDENKNEALLKITPFRGDIAAIEPLNENDFSVTMVSKSEDKIVYDLKGVRTFILETEDGEYFKYKGDNISFVLEVKFEDGKLKSTKLKTLDGQTDVTQVFGTDIFDWYSSGLFKRTEEECSSDEDCEEILHKIIGFTIVCENGICKYERIE
ncbi:MAG: hypothetical protein GY863_20450 [bacterium]|nr:hypothetical protein [bacterium]